MLSGSVVALGASSGAYSMTSLDPWFVGIRIIIGGILAALLNGASNGLNQIFDLEIDRINKPDRPLPSGRMSLREAWGVTVLCYGLSILMAFWIHLACAALVVMTTLFTIAYSAPPLRTKRHWLAAAFTIAIPRGAFLKVAGWTVIRDIFTWEPWFLGGIFALFLLGANGTKDYADIAGDRAGKCVTLPIRFGVVHSIWIISPFFTCPFLLFPIGVHTGILTGNPVILWLLGISLTVWGAYVVWLLLKDPQSLTSSENHPSWQHMYLMMMYAQIGLALAYVVHG
jgi:4-hydroxybenzoate polyprenyltransferase